MPSTLVEGVIYNPNQAESQVIKLFSMLACLISIILSRHAAEVPKISCFVLMLVVFKYKGLKQRHKVVKTNSCLAAE